MSDASFEKQRPAIFRPFAVYPIDFVGASPGSGAAASIAEPRAAVTSGPAAVIQLLAGRRWALTDLAFTLAAVALAVVMVLNPPGGSGPPPAAGTLFRFDALGVGSSTIQVYPGVRDSPAARSTTAPCSAARRRRPSARPAAAG